MNVPVDASRAAAVCADPYAQWWDYAQQIARALWAGLSLPPIAVYGPVMDTGERAYISGHATYSRFAPGDNSYTALGAMVFARPAITASALAAQGIINHRRGTAARRAGEPAWRNTRETHVIVTSERLLTNSPSGWLSFWHETFEEFYVDLHRWTMVIGFGAHPCPPVRLTGACVPAISVLTAKRLAGDQWSAEPRLASLLG
jgi:hypothetical protein